MKKEFYVFRHGETDLNKMKCWQGSGMDYDLNATGIAQGEALADKLAGRGLEIIYSSPLKRALHTAEIVGAALEIPVVVENDLRECHYGMAEGRSLSEFPDYLTAWQDPCNMEVAIPGGEKKGEALQRVLRVFDHLLTEPSRIMGVAIHRGTMLNLLWYYHFDFEGINLPNCAVFHLIHDEEGWRIEGSLF